MLKFFNFFIHKCYVKIPWQIWNQAFIYFFSISVNAHFCSLKTSLASSKAQMIQIRIIIAVKLLNFYSWEFLQLIQNAIQQSKIKMRKKYKKKLISLSFWNIHIQIETSCNFFLFNPTNKSLNVWEITESACLQLPVWHLWSNFLFWAHFFHIDVDLFSDSLSRNCSSCNDLKRDFYNIA